jgi:hypothetical protein
MNYAEAALLAASAKARMRSIFGTKSMAMKVPST